MGVRTLLKPLVICIAVGVSGCQYDPYADEMTTVKPVMADIAGTYVFEKQTVREGDPKGGTITFNPSGTFAVANVIQFADDDSEYDILLNRSGYWKIDVVGGISGAVRSKKLWGMTLTNMPTQVKTINLMGDKPPYKLLITYGDPDEGKVMIFRKE